MIERQSFGIKHVNESWLGRESLLVEEREIDGPDPNVNKHLQKDKNF